MSRDDRQMESFLNAPRMFRTMKEDGGRPTTGVSRGELGARLPGGTAKEDVKPDGDGLVHPGGGGMSVSPSLRDLPPNLIPRRLQGSLARDARAPNDWRVWRLGTTPFAPGAVGTMLQLRPDQPRDGKTTHGAIEPSRSMPVDEYQGALQSTRDAWEIDES